MLKQELLRLSAALLTNADTLSCSRTVSFSMPEKLKNIADRLEELAEQQLVELAQNKPSYLELQAQIEQLQNDSWSAYGDGFYDGYLRYAKLRGDTDFTDDAIRQSELAESDSVYGKQVGSSVRVAEIKAQAVTEFGKDVIAHFEGRNYNLTRQTLEWYINEKLRQAAKEQQ